MNPFREKLAENRTVEPATIVIFGASGDLTKRKLIPALYNLASEHHLPKIAIVGCSRSKMSDEEFRARVKEGVQAHARTAFEESTWQNLEQAIFYHSSSLDGEDAFRGLGERIDRIEADLGLPGNRLYYLSTPPRAFAPLIAGLGGAGLVAKGDVQRRVIIEKPFGKDLGSAQQLNAQVREVLDESQIYRIDHYLGKETVQNLLVFRFANGIFEPLWNSRYIDHVQITGAETLGVEKRGGYFDHAGILRDMVQNHLFQVLCLAAMEPPVSFEANSVRDEKLKVLQALRPIKPAEMEQRVVRGQYARGSVLGKEVPGYLEEDGVAEASKTETFVALELHIDNWRWSGVPFYLRSAKRMPKKVTEVAIHFKAAPHRMFAGQHVADVSSNVLAIRIQPDEGITMSIGSKVPGPSVEIAPVTMEFRYASSFGLAAPEAYERLLLDALVGDETLFTRGDEVEASWKFITPIHEAWAASETRPRPYPAGSWGPDASSDLLEADGRRWRRP